MEGMNGKQVVGLVLLSIGVVLVLFAFHRMGVVPEKKQEMTTITNSPVSPTERAPEKVEKSSPAENGEAMWILVGGIAMAIVGTGIAIRYRGFGA